VNIPYGVISSEGPFVTALAEKPSQRFLCNAGIYVLSPDCLALVERATYTNITDLIELCLARRLPVAVFPVHEYWTDIGTPDDLEKARALFSTVLQTK
jgi:NDP-sugar pyrophosphorylase family protein